MSYLFSVLVLPLRILLLPLGPLLPVLLHHSPLFRSVGSSIHHIRSHSYTRGPLTLRRHWPRHFELLTQLIINKIAWNNSNYEFRVIQRFKKPFSVKIFSWHFFWQIVGHFEIIGLRCALPASQRWLSDVLLSIIYWKISTEACVKKDWLQLQN